MTRSAAPDGGSRTCARCGRGFTWRRKWARVWDRVRYCSAACRRRRRTAIDDALEESIVELLERRARRATICPSEAARSVADRAARPWRSLVEPAREAGRRLAAAGRIEVTQAGRVVDPSTAKGAIRLRLMARPGSRE